jgi:two-component system NtrC family sensor kinase
MSAVSVIFIWWVVHRPIKELIQGTQKVARGDLDYRLPVRSGDELGILASSFNKMTEDLSGAHSELTGWAHTLEERVEQKTRELRRAHEHVLQSEKMASIGKLAAVVAHEINNPLSGILTYTKLLQKWLDRGEWDAARREEVSSLLELIASESCRCGEIVKNLLTFARAAPMHMEWADLKTVVDRVVRLVQHQAKLANIQLQLDWAGEIPPVHCDPATVEQVLLALVMNANDAMPRGGNLWLRMRALPQKGEVQLQVQDDGAGIPPDVLPHLFETFFTTKERGRGVGLGLAISRSIVERYGGRIEVQSELGRGTTFTVTLPIEAHPAAAKGPVSKAEAEKVR